MLLLGGALLLVSLYLPWQRFSLDVHEFGVDPSFIPFGQGPLEGWDSTVAPAAALAALLLVGVSAVAFARPALTNRLPLGRCALASAYFGVAVAVDTRAQGEPFVGQDTDLSFAYGAYLGLGAAATVVLATLVLRRAEIGLLRSPLYVTGVVLATGLLLVFLLPWATAAGPDYSGITAPPAQVAAVVALCAPLAPRSLALLAALFTAGGFSALTPLVDRRYGAWLGIGLAIAFAAFALSGGIRRPELGRIPWIRLVLSAAGLLLVSTFFLPWQEFCFPADEVYGPLSGSCVSQGVWGSEAAAAAAVLAIGLIVGELGRSDWLPPRAELAAGIVLLVTTLGFQYGHGGEYDLRYGFWIGAACTAVIVVLVATRVRPPPIDARLAPIALCLVYLAVVVPTWWGVLDPFGARRFFWFAPFSWITVAGALLALMLIRLWLELPSDRRPLFLLPTVIAALAGLDLARFETITWGGGIVLALCGLLALCALVEQRRGLGELRIPEILRVDRL